MPPPPARSRERAGARPSAARAPARAPASAPAPGRGDPVAVAVADRLHSAAIHLLRRLRVVDAASGLTAPRLSVLSVLVFGGRQTITALAAAEQVRLPTMTRLVQGLERDRLVRCSPDPADRRRVIVVATARGAKILHEGRARRVEQLAAQLARLAPADLASLEHAATLLEALRENPQ
jgi:DNA-binding MarR family transcriptional regulator